jgi:hypothetical protein
VHGSDSSETAAGEIALYFSDHELLDYTLTESEWLRRKDEV